MVSEKARAQCGPFAASILVLLASTLGLSHAAVRAVPSGYPTIQAGIDAAVEGDSIVIASGTYYERLQLVGKNLTLLGSGASSTTISGARLSMSSSSLLFVDDVDNRTCISGLTFEDNQGDSYSFGGAILCNYDAYPRIEGNIFRNNQAFEGGAIVAQGYGGRTIIRANLFIDNRAAQGGAVSIFYSDAVLIEGNMFERNESNGSIGTGGGVHIQDDAYGLVEIRSNVFFKNRAGYSGGVAVEHGNVLLVSNTFAYNEAYVGTTAGNVRIYGGEWDTLTAVNNIIAHAEGGAGLQVVGSPSAQPVVRLDCNDFWANEGGDFALYLASVSHGPGDFSADPLFCNPLIGQLSLASGSPCLPENNPTCGLVGALGMGCAEVAGVDDLNHQESKEILRVNARRGEDVEFVFDAEVLTIDGASLQIFDLQGRAIRRLDASTGLRTGGTRWDRRNDSGRPVPTGVYFARLDIGNLKGTASFVLLR